MKKQAKKKEREYMSKVASLGCWICEAPANVHHIRPKGLGMGRRSSHYDTIPLCYFHHQGQGGIHHNKKIFEEKYGTELEILAKVKERIKNES